ncbi:hypothetical protein B0T11DRAFT_283738 [Plectosphaerella cucumerina]|uniref:JmjC domain-containing protein n=1 Tax=Plectosphaerella cucumerina TaxID=40658 RepID=A0A8K0TGF8_9PEZI|nr:hypothetical protein B0T11DRAFT_283738 [Plectosphaerella cucumerina]
MDLRKASDPDGRILVLGVQKYGLFRQFLQTIRSCDSETERYRLCVAKRDQLLDRTDLLSIEREYYATAFSESTTFRARKDSDADWLSFTTTSSRESSNQARFSQEVKRAAKFWGEALVQNYIGNGQGIRFAIQLAGAAEQHPDWEKQALPRLQQLVRRRIQLGSHGRHTFVHPIETTDLINAKAWVGDRSYVKMNDPEHTELPLESLAPEQLPQGYAFDKYGLLIQGSVQVSDSNMSFKLEVEKDRAKEIIESPGVGGISNSRDASTDSGSTSGVDDLRVASEVYGTEEIGFSPKEIGFGSAHITAGLSGTLGHIPRDTFLRRSLRKAATKPTDSFQTAEAEASRPPSRCASRNGNNRNRRAVTAKASPKATPLNTGRLRTLITKLPSTGLLMTHKTTPMIPRKRQRANSLPVDISPRHPKGGSTTTSGVKIVPGHGDHDGLSVCTTEADQTYLSEVIQEMQEKLTEAPTSRGYHTARTLLPILLRCTHPNTDAKNGSVDLLVLDGHEAKNLLDSKTPSIPIVSERQQHFQWRNPQRPTEEFFDWIEDHDRVVSVQIPSASVDRRSFEPRTIRQVRERFLAAQKTDDPWNVLDLDNPVPSTLPDILTGWNCQLLARVRDMVLNGQSAERTKARRDDWDEWRSVEHWALMSEGGHCTAPHMDSHGLATWITVQEGLFGFVYMSRPTSQQREDWMRDPDASARDQEWRFLILKPGQTIFFPSGTIHGVFRTRSSATLALGGHVLQWSGISDWIDIISKEVEFPNSTNEDVDDAWKWVPVIEHLVQMRVNAMSAKSGG